MHVKQASHMGCYLSSTLTLLHHMILYSDFLQYSIPACTEIVADWTTIVPLDAVSPSWCQQALWQAQTRHHHKGTSGARAVGEDAPRFEKRCLFKCQHPFYRHILPVSVNHSGVSTTGCAKLRKAVSAKVERAEGCALATGLGSGKARARSVFSVARAKQHSRGHV